MIEYLIVLVLSFPPLLWFRDGFVLLGHDSGFRLDRWAQLPNLWYSWDPKLNFGVDWSLFKGFLVTQLPETIIGQKLSLVFWFFIMGWGMLVFLRAVFPGERYRFFRLFSSIFYMYNFFILSGWEIGERAKFSLYAALPIGLTLVYNVFEKQASPLKNGILFGLLYFFLNGGGVFPMYGATLIVLGVAFVFFRGVKKILYFLVPFLLFNAYFIAPNVALLTNSFSSSVSSQGGIDGLILWERVISKSASFLNLLRLQGIPSWYDNPVHPFSYPYLTNPVLILLSFVPILSILMGVVRVKNKPKIIKFLLVLLPIGLAFTMGTHPPTGILYEFAMKKIPGFLMFRSSFYKFAPALWFPMIVLTGYFLNELVRSKIAKFVIIICLLAYHFPFFTNTFFTFGDNFSTRVKVPEYLANIGSGIKSHVPHDGTILVMPKMPMYFPDLPADIYEWGYFGLDMLPRNAIHRRFVANDSHDPIVDRLYEALYEGDRQKFNEVATILGVSHVLWRGDTTVEEENILDSNTQLVRIFETGPWILYALQNSSEPHVFATTRIQSFTGSAEAESFFVATQSSIVRVLDESRLIEAECMLCDPNEFEKLVGSIGLSSTRISPDSWLFWFEKWRQEKQIERTQNIPKQRIDTNIALAQKYFSWSDNDRAMEFMQDAVSTWKTLNGRDKVTYAIRLKAYLEAQKQPVSEELEKSIWMSEPGIYRYLIDLPEDVYSINLTGGVSQITIDGFPYQLGTKKKFIAGLHSIEVYTQGRRPHVVFERANAMIDARVAVSYKKINPTKFVARIRNDSGGPFLLTLKEHFDSRWSISEPGATHVMVNGFANGWIIKRNGEYDVTFYYWPQTYFYWGLAITVVTCIGVGIARLKKYV